MTREEAKKRIDELCDRLNFLSYKYYVDNESPVSDYDYDMLQRELKSLEEQYPEFLRADSPTVRVGGMAESIFTPVTHEVKMESLQDAFSYEEIDDFDRRVGDSVNGYTYVVEPKIDGLSVALEYENGIFRAKFDPAVRAMVMADRSLAQCIRVEAAPGMAETPLAESCEINIGKWLAPGQYFRLEIMDERGRFAWSNPIRFKAAE